MKKIFLTILAVLILSLTPVSAAEVWTLPDEGLQLANAPKQKYIAEKMDAVFHSDNPPVAKFDVPYNWRYEILDLEGLKVECLENPNAGTNRVVLQLHGGGYVLPLTNGHRNLAIKQAVLAQASKIYMVDYRIAPANTYPAALDDAVKAYNEILNRGTYTDDIIVIGDSAGGNLALELSLYLKENKMRQPKMLILVSPWATMQTSLPSRKYNETRDLVLGKGASPLYDAVRKPAYARGFKANDARLSPIYADLKKLPPMLIQAGGYELFLDECVKLAKKAAADEVKVTLTIYPGMPHDFALMLPDLQESVDSFAEIRNFINMNMN